MKTLTPFNNMPKRDDVVAVMSATHTEWTKRKIENAVNRRMKYLEDLAAALPRNCIEIEVVWKRSAMWGHNPSWNARAWYEGKDGQWKYDSLNQGYANAKGGPIGGCGYCKRSTATAQALNSLLMPYLFRLNPKLFARERNDNGTTKSGMPYGFSTGCYGAQKKLWTLYNPGFDGGVGVNCHLAVIQYLGGQVISERTCDKGDTDFFSFKLPPLKEAK